MLVSKHRSTPTRAHGIPYIGFPRVLNAVTLLKEVMAERGLTPKSPSG